MYAQEMALGDGASTVQDEADPYCLALRVALCDMVPLVFFVLFCMGSAALLGAVTNLKKTKV